MKKFIFTLSLLLVVSGLYAQQPGRGPGGGMRPDGNGRPPGEMGRGNRNSDSKVYIEELPEIPGLTLEQQLKLGKFVSAEHEQIGKQMDKKRALMEQSGDPDLLSQKQLEKQRKKMQRIDKKIAKIRTKYDKKIQKLLTDEQYLVYIERKEEIKFRPGSRNEESSGGERPDGRMGESPPPRR